MAFAGTMLKLTGWAMPPGEPRVVAVRPPVETPVARIQFRYRTATTCAAPSCSTTILAGYQEGGTGQCTIPRDMMTVWNVNSRAEAFAQAFRSSWKGDALASSLRWVPGGAGVSSHSKSGFTTGAIE